MAGPKDERPIPSFSQGYTPSADPANCGTSNIKNSDGYRKEERADNLKRSNDDNDRLKATVALGAGSGAAIGGGIGSGGGPIPAAIGAGVGAVAGTIGALIAGSGYQTLDTNGDDMHTRHMKDYVTKTQQSCLADLAEKQQATSGAPSSKAPDYNSLKTALPFGTDPHGATVADKGHKTATPFGTDPHGTTVADKGHTAQSGAPKSVKMAALTTP